LPIEFNERPIGQIDYITNFTKFLDIPRDRAIRRIVMRFLIDHTTGGVAPTYTEDNILNVIKKIRLVLNGNDNKFNVNARLWYYVEQFEKETVVHFIAPTSAISTNAVAEVVLIADFAQDRTNEDDVSSLLPARRFASIRLEIDWGGTTDLATANAPTINVASRCLVEIREVTGEDTILINDQPQTKNLDDMDFTDIREGMDTVPIDANYGSFDNSTLKKNVIPAPAQIRTQLLMVRDQTAPAGNKSNALVTDIKLQKEVGRTRNFLQRTFHSLRGEQKVEYALETLPTGIIYLDYMDKFINGIINSGNEGDIKFRFLTTGFVAGQNIDIFTRSVEIPFVRLT